MKHQYSNYFLSENVLGLELKAQDIVSSILTESRLSTGASCITLMRELLRKFTEHCKNVSIGGMNLIETDTALTKIGDVSRVKKLGFFASFFNF